MYTLFIQFRRKYFESLKRNLKSFRIQPKHTYTSTNKRNGKHFTYLLLARLFVLQPSNNLQLVKRALLATEVSLNLCLQSQTSDKAQRNNVYFPLTVHSLPYTMSAL